ncbi:MAG: glutathione S-transferase N-terminal domain-containing protein [Burkholderiaceae bacterium]|nr:glutathione S-transferase N-terminal domain-containing protein [Burkholderiaceae bacterium]
MPPRRVTLFHSPQTRSTGALILLEELHADYELHVLNMKAGEQRGAAYLAINPMGKVPAVMHKGALVTEQVAVFLYLADLYSDAGITPTIGDPLRGPYLRWMAFYGSCFEPAFVDKSLKREPGSASMMPYGTVDDVWGAVTAQLSKGDYMLGDKFTALDVLWGTALNWMTMFGLAPETPVTRAYIDRIKARPSVARAAEIDAEWLKKQAGLPQ